VVIEGAADIGSDDDRDLPPWGEIVVRATPQLDERDLSGLGALVADATAADGVPPLSEHAVLHLRTAAGPHARHLLVRGRDSAPEILALAHVDLAAAGDHATVEIVVRPDQRRHGLGSALLAAAAELSGDSPLRAWAHGNLPAAQGFARAHRYEAVRELWQMSRPLDDALPTAPLPAGFTMRAFRPGEDDHAWLAVNAGAFAHHAEQGAWQAADLQQRMAEPWFDPAGFLLLVDDASGELAGFHWTKVHPAAEHAGGSDAAGDATAGHGGVAVNGAGEVGYPGGVHDNGAGDEATAGAGAVAYAGGVHGNGAGDEATAGAGAVGADAVGPVADDGRVGEVYVVGVAPDFQGRGLAKPLTLAGLQHLRDEGLTTVILYVDGDNDAAVRTYSGLGFTRRALDVQYARG
jgi:mycothiol synthase